MDTGPGPSKMEAVLDLSTQNFEPGTGLMMIIMKTVYENLFNGL